jgi:hypothetical protein
MGFALFFPPYVCHEIGTVNMPVIALSLFGERSEQVADQV